MALLEFNVGWNLPDPPGGAGVTPEVGDEWRIYLDQDLFTDNVNKPIVVTYVSTLPQDAANTCAGITTYRVSFDDSNLPTGRANFTSCDVQDLQCYTCEDKLIEERNLKIFYQTQVP